MTMSTGYLRNASGPAQHVLGSVGAVVLTYNSADDLPACLDGLFMQRGVDARVIVVDNASSQQSLETMEEDFRTRAPEGIIVDANKCTLEVLKTSRAFFLRNCENAGYSAGNNIGARLAVAAGCQAVLLVNPDVRITDPDYLAKLWAEMNARPECLVASSRLVNLEGYDEHPLRETQFWEELFWVRQFGPHFFRPAPYVQPPRGTEPVDAHKIHGSCQLIRASFLEETGYLDENVFLYCEEPIMAARVRAAGGRMLVFPKLKAIHAHISSTKGNASRRMLQFIKSRLYYIDTYTDYGSGKRAALHVSYRLLSFMHRIKALFGPA